VQLLKVKLPKVMPKSKATPVTNIGGEPRGALPGTPVKREVYVYGAFPKVFLDLNFGGAQVRAEIATADLNLSLEELTVRFAVPMMAAIQPCLEREWRRRRGILEETHARAMARHKLT
jgi:hypothetical protein